MHASLRKSLGDRQEVAVRPYAGAGRLPRDVLQGGLVDHQARCAQCIQRTLVARRQELLSPQRRAHDSAAEEQRPHTPQGLQADQTHAQLQQAVC